MMTGKNVLTVRSLIILVPIIFTGLYIGKQYHSDYNMYMDMQKYLPGRNEVPMGPVVNDGGGDCYNTFIALQSDQNNIPFGSIPMLDDATVQLYCTLLHKDLSVLEWGCGGSTVYFSSFVKKWRCIDHDPAWAKIVKENLQNKSHKEVVTVTVIKPSTPYNSKIHNDGNYAQFREYIEFPGSLGEKFGLIMDDGRARVDAALSIIRNDLLEDNGVVLIHDWERRPYRKVLSQGFQIWKEETTSWRDLSVLQIKKKQSSSTLLL